MLLQSAAARRSRRDTKGEIDLGRWVQFRPPGTTPHVYLEVPLAPGTFRAYRRMLGNYPSALRLLNYTETEPKGFSFRIDEQKLWKD